MKETRDIWLLLAAAAGVLDIFFGFFAAAVLPAFALGILWNQSGSLLRRYALLVAAICLAVGYFVEPNWSEWVGRGGLVCLCALGFYRSFRLQENSETSARLGAARFEREAEEDAYRETIESEYFDSDLGSAGEELSTRAATRVPLRFRLIDTGIFSRRQASQIDSVVSRVGDENAGLDRCIEENLLTRMQAGFIVQRRERELRVGCYRLLTELGRGSMGVVYQAMDTDRNNQVALKLFSNRNRNLMMIRREMAVIQELVHPNIVTALEVGDSDGRHFIAMELIDGETMLTRVRRDGVFPESTALRLCLGIAKALEQAHRRQILHRDVKPGNVMITDGEQCKLLDFGICRPPRSLREHDSQAIEGAMLYGTLGFVSPEQAMLDEDLDSRSDIYGLGCTLFFALTGEYHVLGETPAEKLKNLTVNRRFHSIDDFEISDSVKAILSRTLAFEKCDRYQNATEVVQELSQLLKNQGELPAEMVVHVLIVESDTADLRIIMKLLHRCNESFEIQRADSFADAVTEVRRHRELTDNPLVVLVDLDLPDSDRVRTIKRFRDLSADNVGVVGLADATDAETKRRCLAAGFLDYLPKSDLSSRRLERAIFANHSRLK